MSEQVKRYAPFGDDSMRVIEHGAYVRYDDYATLQAECRKLRAELAAIKAQLTTDLDSDGGR